ncbi:MAG TPA: GNAT family N-acetyltransferase [Acetobacteraceae bacterium]|nr:GNAT family N-acetyltransferase [Acetobacteraceae bacterium]
MQPAAEPVHVRPSLETDVAAVTAIYAHHVRHGTASFETEPPAIAEMIRRRAEILARNLPYLVAEQDGAVLGYAYAGPYRLRAAYRHTVEDSVYLRPDAIGRGIGRRLLAGLLAGCEGLGLRQVVAVIGDSANLPSIRLHENLGFRRVGILRSIGHKHGRWLDSVVLQRALGAGDASPPGDPAA